MCISQFSRSFSSYKCKHDPYSQYLVHLIPAVGRRTSSGEVSTAKRSWERHGRLNIYTLRISTDLEIYISLTLMGNPHIDGDTSELLNAPFGGKGIKTATAKDAFPLHQEFLWGQVKIKAQPELLTPALFLDPQALQRSQCQQRTQSIFYSTPGSELQ